VAPPTAPSGLAPVLDLLTRFLSRLRPGPKARLAISFALLGLLLSQTDFAAVPKVLRNANPWLVLSCVFLVAGGRVLVAYRWRLLVRIANPAVGFGELLRLTFVSIFLGFAAPGAVAVEAIRVYGLARGTGLAFALSSVLIERLTAMSALVCLLFLGLMLGPVNLPQALNLVAGAAVGLILITLVTLFVPWLRALPLLLLPGSVLSPLRAGLESVLTQIDLYRSRPITLVCVALLSIVLQALRVLEIIALAAALEINIDPVYFFVVVPISTFLSLLPISARGLGVRESVYVGLLGVVGVDTAAALALSLLSFVIASAVGLLPGALLYATGGIAVSTARAPKTPPA
jgi:glycosyltransferase 2 family protein